MSDSSPHEPDMADNTSQDDFDTPWKDAVEHAFPELD